MKKNAKYTPQQGSSTATAGGFAYVVWSVTSIFVKQNIFLEKGIESSIIFLNFSSKKFFFFRKKHEKKCKIRILGIFFFSKFFVFIYFFKRTFFVLAKKLIFYSDFQGILTLKKKKKVCKTTFKNAKNYKKNF